MSFLSRIFGRRAEPTLQHPVFGTLLLISTKTGAYWEGEPLVGDQTIGLAIETSGEAPPTEAQVRFFQNTVANLDAAFNLAAPLLVSRYEEWTRGKFPRSWRDAFKFAGISVPLDGVETNDWELTFECIRDEDGHLFTCYFENGRPAHVSVDG